MTKRLLIISPYFPPSNAADMHRVRISLPYYREFGWEVEVVTVDERYADIVKDNLLLQSIPTEVKIHKVKALNKRWTSKIGLGSIALRSYWFYKYKVNGLLKSKNYDLIFFSTTQFPVCTLGAYWKKKFGVPYVIDIQDPWHSEYYQDKPKDQRPAKHWFSYRLNKYLEPIAVKNAAGLISVSQSYIDELKKRYSTLINLATQVITFGVFAADMEIALFNKWKFPSVLKSENINIVYTGRGGADMHKSITPLFQALKTCLINSSKFDQIKIYFVGTSYAAVDGSFTIIPLAIQHQVESHVVEIPGRVPYYQALSILQEADALFIPGSDDPGYSASKVYPYLMAQKPTLAILNKNSPVNGILNEFELPFCIAYDHPEVIELISRFLNSLVDDTMPSPVYQKAMFEKYSAENLCRNQCKFFDLVIAK